MSFETLYEFDETSVVIIQHTINNKTLRVHPKQPRRINHSGGKGKFARWEAQPTEDGAKVRLKSIHTGKYLRIMEKNDKHMVDVAGTGGKFTVFDVEMIEDNQLQLESEVFPNVFIAVDSNGVRTGSGGKFCNLRIYSKGSTDSASTSEEEEEEEEEEDVETKEDYEIVQKEQAAQEDEDDEDGSIIIHNEEKDNENDNEADDEERLLSDVLNNKLLEGYCLVFDRESEYFQMEVSDMREVGDAKFDLPNMEHMCSLRNMYGIQNDNDKSLQWLRKPDIADEEFNDKAPKKDRKRRRKDPLRGFEPNNVLKGFNHAHIQYKIIWSRPSLHEEDEEDKINPNDDIESKYIYVVIWMEPLYVEKYADYQDVSVLINREEAIKAGRRFDEFHLAHRTYLASVDPDDKIAINEEEIEQRKAFASDADDIITYPEIKMLPIECWNNIHIPFEFSVKNDPDQNNIYELYPAANAPSYRTVVTHRVYLRILYACLVDDRKMKGANFLVDLFLKQKINPFVDIFALHEFDNEKFYPVRNSQSSKLSDRIAPKFAERLFTCNWKLGWLNAETFKDLNDDLREYYGEYLAFYYAFLGHYIQSLLPMVVIGIIWFVVQTAAGTISVAGSAFYVMICVLWSTITIETWYRREGALRFKWGMCRYRETEVPRPTFKGRVRVSLYNGDIIETHKNIHKHWLKIAFSLSTMVLCIAIVIVVVGTIWILKRKWKDDAGYKMAIGVINAVQIKVFNWLYTKLAYTLNEFEQHRLVEDYYNHLVIKRIIFMIVNSFNSLFYMAFYDDSYVDNTDRLSSLRIQLFTLFFTSIVILNFMEVMIPKIPQWIRRYKAHKRKKQMHELPKNMQKGMAIQHTNVDTVEIDVDIAMDDEAEAELKELRFNGGLDGMIILDIEKQCGAPKVPDNLDNVAEIVILQGYIIVFAVVFPLMPLLAYLNAILEIRIDVHNLTGAKRPFPLGADGLGVWKSVLSVFNTLSVFSNMAVIAWDTNLPEVVLQLGYSGKIIWYFLNCLIILLFMISVRMILPNESLGTQQAIARQEQCENLVTLLQDSTTARKDKE